MADLLYEEITYQIRGACFWVYKEFRGSFKESIVDNALTKELISRGLTVEDQKRIDIFYKGKKVGVYVPDKIINEKVLLEIKCKPVLAKGDIDQFWKYLKGSNYKLGLLINFSPEGLKIERVVYDKVRNKN
ncbi:GxxExxY protein [Patescibacteria group bacterium]|nr:GxxExxY protein [Patescibacteria group bacterium]MBU2220022.1 GxxExxY protein [Patescibacteria group bacterium]MBU2265106.1 GxxExxY protein [Patescibacteria group bacterium]